MMILLSRNAHKQLGQFVPRFLSSPSSIRKMATSSSSSTAEIESILSFWYNKKSPSDNPMQRWFMGGSAFDQECQAQFNTQVLQARANEFDSWTASPRGTLALLILLDQFPRNIFRGRPEAFASDAKASALSTWAIAAKQHLQLSSPYEQMFMIMPLMHDEKLISQVAMVALLENLMTSLEPGEDKELMKMTIESGQKHLEVIRKFGRFPSRNEILGRESTPEELAFLKESGPGF